MHGTMRLVSFTFLSLLLTLLVGCATPETASLSRTANSASFTLDAPLTRLLGSGTIEQGLLPGVYQSAFENERGTFFQGPARSFFEHKYPVGDLQLRIGGVWIPTSPTVRPRLYFVFEPEHHSAKSVEAAIQANAAPLSDAAATLTGRAEAQALGSSIVSATQAAATTPGAIKAQALGGVIGGGIVSVINESSRGEHFLLGEVPNDPLVPRLEALAAKIRGDSAGH